MPERDQVRCFLQSLKDTYKRFQAACVVRPLRIIDARLPLAGAARTDVRPDNLISFGASEELNIRKRARGNSCRDRNCSLRNPKQDLVWKCELVEGLAKKFISSQARVPNIQR